MSDLFISYSSHDRPWAERLFQDLQAKFKTLKIFWDRESIPPGVNWRDVLEREKREANYFAVFWSEKAKGSNEVGPEIEAFLNRPGSKEKMFYIPLEGSRGPQEENQGFPDFKPLYKRAAEVLDRGVSGLNEDPYQNAWKRMIRQIGGTIQNSKKTQPVKLAVLCMKQGIVDVMEPFLNQHTMPGPTLKEFLDGIGLTWEQVKGRYQQDALDWCPFGTSETVLDFMEEIRVTANNNMKEAFWFHWDAVDADLVAVTRAAKTEDDLRKKFEALASAPSVVVIDPISLYNPAVAVVFPRLDEYVKKEQSVIVSLCPRQEEAVDWIYRSLLSRGAPLLNGYFLPAIPALSTFARCGLNLQHQMDLERLLRMSLGSFYLHNKQSESDPFLSPGE